MSSSNPTTHRLPIIFKLQRYLLLIMLFAFGVASASTTVDTISSGNLSATYTDGSRIFVSPNASVTAQSFTLKNNCTLVIGDFATVTIQNGFHATTGANCKIILGSGSTLQIDSNASLTLGNGSLLDCKNGSLNLSEDTTATLSLSQNSTLSLGNIPVSGKGTIAAPPYANYAQNQQYAFLDAPCTFIFNGVSVTGMWHIDRAYPQWFAEPGCDDWSIPINKAIAMKRTGEVFLQRGRYQTKHSIRVGYGIELTGESGLIFINSADNFKSDFLGTTIVANKEASPYSNFQSGYMVLVNTKPVNQYPSATKPINEQTGMWIHPFPAFITSVRNITFKNGDDDNHIVPQLNCLFTAGGLDIELCRFIDFKQAIVKSRDYADGFVIKDCRFSGANKAHYANAEATSAVDTTIYDTKWMISLDGDGDNLQIRGNFFDGSKIKNNRTIYVGRNRGGTITDNITGGEILFAGCRGLSFVNNHMESSLSSGEGPIIKVFSSQMEISNNFFYKSERGNILLSATGYGVPTVAEIHNNTYLCTYHELDAVNQADLRNEFNRIKEIWMVRSVAPEIIVGYGATANITNQYRQVALKASLTWPLTVGIQFGTEMQNGTPTPNDSPRTLLNNLSPYISCSGIINAGFSINGINHQLRNINKRTALMMPNTNDRWYAPSGEYEYYAVFVIDRQRNIIAYPSGKPYKQLMHNNASSLSKDNFIDTPGSADAVSTLISIHGESSAPTWSGYLRMYRCCTNSAGSQIWDTVDVPVVNTMILYDNGLFLSGYPWQKCENPLDTLNDTTDTLKIQDVTHINESVECTATTKPTSLPDTWNRGDKIYNVGNQTDWTIFIKK